MTQRQQHVWHLTELACSCFLPRSVLVGVRTRLSIRIQWGCQSIGRGEDFTRLTRRHANKRVPQQHPARDDASGIVARILIRCVMQPRPKRKRDVVSPSPLPRLSRGIRSDGNLKLPSLESLTLMAFIKYMRDRTSPPSGPVHRLTGQVVFHSTRACHKLRLMRTPPRQGPGTKRLHSLGKTEGRRPWLAK